jgi:nucleoside-diphosphate-sugar epimerase
VNILLTGAFGYLGSLVLPALIDNGHSVIAFDVRSGPNSRLAKGFEGAPGIRICWGDIRDRQLVEILVNQVDAVVHLAAIIVPASEARPALAYEVNVVGTQHIVDSIREMERKPLLAYCSSFAVFGPQRKPPPRNVSEEPIASDHYTRHKIACEEMIRAMQSPWVILRLGGMADSRMHNRGWDQAKYALSMSGNNRFEYIHPKDVAVAFVNVLTQNDAHRQIHLIGGGSTCQVTHKDVLNATLGAMGVTLSDTDFGEMRLYADWSDTDESQRLLQFQRHSFEDFRRESRHAFRFIRPFVRPFAPAIRRLLKVLV